MANDHKWRRVYRILARCEGVAGLHRGMTAMTRDEWRAVSEARARLAKEIAHD